MNRSDVQQPTPTNRPLRKRTNISRCARSLFTTHDDTAYAQPTRPVSWDLAAAHHVFLHHRSCRCAPRVLSRPASCSSSATSSERSNRLILQPSIEPALELPGRDGTPSTYTASSSSTSPGSASADEEAPSASAAAAAAFCPADTSQACLGTAATGPPAARFTRASVS
jgi:hypothetical protein